MTFTYQVETDNVQFGDNVAGLRKAVASDILIRRVMNTLRAKVSVLAYSQRAHTGSISEATAQLSCSGDASGIRHPNTVAVLDSDSPGDLPPTDDIASASGSTLNASQTPARLAHKAGEANALMPALADAVRSRTGSLAIAVQSERDPDALLLGVRGSTPQPLRRSRPNSWIVTSEPYGLVEDAERYLRLGGGPRRRGAAGSVAILHRNAPGELAGIERHHLDGRPHPVDSDDIESVEITTRNPALGYGTSTPRRQRRKPA